MNLALLQKILALLRKIDEHCISWNELRDFSFTSAVRLSYFFVIVIPIFAKLFSAVDDVLPIILFGKTFDLTLTFPFSWKLAYFSSVSVALGKLVFDLNCPRFLKRFPEYNDFNWTAPFFVEGLSV